MTPEEFKARYYGNFAISTRDIALQNRVAAYMRETENVAGELYWQHRNRFRDWCDQNGYRRPEVVAAKRQVESWPEFR